jgi:RNA polymerase sigma factor (sigma-70 family)
MEPDPESSLELIHRAQDGDADAVDRLLRRYRPRLRRWASGRLPRYARDMTDTEDVVQDVLIRTIQNFKDFEHRGEWALQAYLRRAVVNRIRDELSRTERRPRRAEFPESLASDEASPLEAALGRELFGQYEAALAALGEAEREAVIARLELGCSYQEIAQLVDKPTADAARMTVTRALVRVAELMSPKNPPAPSA